MYRLFSLWLIALVLLSIPVSQASVVISGTRFIYEEGKKEKIISISNADKNNPQLVQAWVELEQSGAKKKAPFVVTPPIFRLNGGQENKLRIIRIDGELPQDRESVFWLNVKSVPSSVKSEENQLHIAVKSKLKLFFRPRGLPGNAKEAYQQLSFTQQGNQLQARNPTPYFVSLKTLSINGREIKMPGMIAPQSTLSWAASGQKIKTVTWKAINDHGGATPEAKISL